MAVSRNRLSTDGLPGRVGAFLAARSDISRRFCIGLSGGCDSVVLLHLLSRLGLGERLAALHVHHGLSPNADAWADLCADYCARLTIPLSIVRVDVARQSGLGLEAAARSARYAAFRQCGAENLLLAHHQGDQAETLLFNLLRGSGVAGAAAMPVKRHLDALCLLRPLLGVSRAEIEAYARANDLRWIDDESNADTRHARNFLRHDVMPVLSGRFPAAESALAQAAQHFSEADALLAELAAADWQRACSEGDDAPSLRALRSLSAVRLKNLLRYRLRELGWRAPVAARLDEFVRQLLTAAPDRHPALHLVDGHLSVVRGRLRCAAQK